MEIKVEKWAGLVPFLLTKMPTGGWRLDVKGLIQAAIIAIVTAVVVNKLGITRIEERLITIERIMQYQTITMQRDMDRIERGYESLKRDFLEVNPKFKR